MKSDLIITTAIGYEFHQMELFFKSLNKVFNGTVLLLTDTKKKFDTYSFDILIGDIDSDYYKSSLPYYFNSPHNRRLFYANTFIVDNIYWERIMLSDIRDVVFQDDPFNVITNDKVHVAMENVFIGENEYNSKWIRALKGHVYLESVGHQTVSCCGTIFSVRKSILFYLDFITKLITEKGKALDTDSEFLCIDQGSHNVFCNEFPHLVHKQYNADGRILTMSYTTKIVLSGDGLFVNDAGQLYSVIHQYDRYPFLTDMIKKRFGVFYFQDLKNGIKQMLKQVDFKV